MDLTESQTPIQAPVRREQTAAFSPLYQQIRQLLLQALEKGEWKPGEMIPSEFDLARRFHVSQGTVRKAIDELAGEHILIRRQGKGTFVATHREPVVRFRFLRLAPSDGETVPADSEILWCRKVRANAEAAAALELKSGDGLIYIRRLLSFRGQPTVVDDIYLPASLFRGLTMAVLTENTGPLYGLLEARFGVSMVRADERLRAVAAPEDIAELMKIERHKPLLRVDRVSYTYGDRAVELRYGHYLTDQYFYRNTLM
ncbi:GntR family transcriptional regulator [Orrella daihaiensis]|uniref:GntR family transcriptional regulator n=1 Tax=Orrella daihaiensis TaxID=2782176 RepID=A0ABY4AH82_9BURK|nr:GntR family transcriptional regulator [Orrella daihaiensis]UOD49652.1 GntR family transcriptional regulator [Orrella daihaiensis]